MRVLCLLLTTVFWLGVTGAGRASDDALDPGSNEQLQWTSTSSGHLFDVSIRPTESKVVIGRLQSWIVRVTTPVGASVYPAKIVVGGGMKGHGHGLPTQPQVTDYLGGGEYLVEGMRFSMEGIWTISFNIESNIGNDRIDFEIEVLY